MQEKEQKNSPIKRRILQFAEGLNISKRDFYKTIGVSRGTLESSSGITEDIVAKFIARYPQVSPEWLLTGEGGMLRESVRQLAPAALSEAFDLPTDRTVEMQHVPLYDLEASAGLVSLFLDPASHTPVSYLQIPDLPPCDGAVYVRGDSMYPLLKSGDIVLYKEVRNYADVLLWGEIYMISFSIDTEEYVCIKYVQKSDRADFIRLVSYNPHHASLDIPLESIRAMALVKASVRYNTMR